MYTLDNLFDFRSVVGARIELKIKERGITKSQFCQIAGMSRPTFDKLLSGSITIKANFSKYMEKVLAALELTPETLMDGIQHKYNSTRAIRNYLRLGTEDISKATGITLGVIEDLEAGKEIPEPDYYDIATFLGTSTNAIKGTDYFNPQFTGNAILLAALNAKESNENVLLTYGFSGYMGILLQGEEKHRWYPVVADVADNIGGLLRCGVKSSECIMIRCLNNKILLLNYHNVKEIVYVHNDGMPTFVAEDKNDTVFYEPLLPAALYEALDVAYWNDFPSENAKKHLSPKMISTIQKLLEDCEMSLDDFADILYQSTIYYTDKTVRRYSVNFDDSDLLLENLATLSMSDYHTELDCPVVLELDDADVPTTVHVDMDRVSMIEMPYAMVENALYNFIHADDDEFMD